MIWVTHANTGGHHHVEVHPDIWCAAGPPSTNTIDLRENTRSLAAVVTRVPVVAQAWTVAGQGPTHVTGRNAQRGFQPTRNPSTGWFRVPPAVSLSPAVPFCTRACAGMKPPMGRDSSVNVPAQCTNFQALTLVVLWCCQEFAYKPLQ